MTPVAALLSSLPAGAELTFDAALVGGDRGAGSWYDVFALGPQIFGLSVGIVRGGPAAATAMAQAVRQSFTDSDGLLALDAALGRADSVLRSRTAACIEAFVGIVDTAARTLTYIGAAGTAPLIRFADGFVCALPADGARARGADRDLPAAHVVLDLHGAEIVLLPASSPVAEADSAARWLAALSDERIGAVSEPAAFVARRAAARDDGRSEVALLVLRLAPHAGAEPDPMTAGERPRWTASWKFDAESGASIGARRAFLACLRSKPNGTQPIDLDAAELIFGELLGNVVRHAPGTVEIRLDWNELLPVLHVLDSGPGFRSRRKRERLPVDAFSESGRGLFIVNACSVAFSVRNRNGRGTHASAVLAPLAR